MQGRAFKSGRKAEKYLDGKIEKLKLGNGLIESAKLNSRSQVTELALGHSVGDGSLLKLNYDYGELNTDGSVDATKNAGNIAKQTVNFSGLTNPFIQTYKYDSLDRITEAIEKVNGTQTWKQTFGYDIYGNRNSFYQKVGATELTINSSTLPSVVASTNRFAASQGFGYDKNGNITTDPACSGRTFIFNGDNKQTEVKDSNNYTIGRYYYDGEGHRIKKVTDSETTIFVYANGNLVAEYSTATPPSNPTTNYTATDMLGSPRVLTDSQGSVVSRRDFMPFGEEIYADGTYRKSDNKYSTSGQDAVRQRFTGYQKDAETGLDFAEARYYNNQHGRFTAVDPLMASASPTNPQTFNRFVYVLNNPIRLTDSSGLQAGSKGAPTMLFRVTNQENDTREWKIVRGNITDRLRGKGWQTLTEAYTGTIRTGTQRGQQITYFPNGSSQILPGANPNDNPFGYINDQVARGIDAGVDEFGSAAYAVAPDYIKAQCSLPVVGGLGLSMSKDFRFFLGGGKLVGSVSDKLGLVKAAQDIGGSGKLNLQGKLSCSFMGGYFFNRDLSPDERSNAMSGGSVSVTGGDGAMVGLNQSFPLFSGERAVEVGYGAGGGLGTSGSFEIFDLKKHLRERTNFSGIYTPPQK